MIRHRAAAGESEEAVRDTARPRTEDLEDGVPLPLLKHGIEVLRALATAAASTAERRVARKDINSKPPHGSWQALFDASKPSSESLVFYVRFPLWLQCSTPRRPR